MEFEWHPEMARAITYLIDCEENCLSPEGATEVALSLIASLYVSTSRRFDYFGENEQDPVDNGYGYRSLEDIKAMAQWAAEIVRAHHTSGMLHSAAVLLKPKQPLCDWSCSLYSWSETALLEAVGEAHADVDHNHFPGCPEPTLNALPESLVAALGLVAANKFIQAWESGDHRNAIEQFAAASELDRGANSMINQRVGQATVKAQQREEMRRRGAIGGSKKNIQANRLKAWLDGQPNPTKRSDLAFARKLIQSVPLALTEGLADPTRVAYEHLRTKITAT